MDMRPAVCVLSQCDSPDDYLHHLVHLHTGVLLSFSLICGVAGELLFAFCGT